MWGANHKVQSAAACCAACPTYLCQGAAARAGHVTAALEKAKVVQFFLWIERYNEDDVKTHATGPLSKVSLNLHKISASKFLT